MRVQSFLICLMLAWAVQVAAQDPVEVPANKADIVRLLARMDEFVPIEDEFISLGFRGENLQLAMEQHRRVFGDPAIASYIADRLLAAHAGRLPSAGLTGGLLGPLIDRGIGHLPTDDLVYFYKVENTVFNALPYRECGLAVKQQLSDQRLSNATAQAAARLNAPALKAYYRIQHKAAKLGLRNKRVVLGKARTARIEQKIGEKIFAGSESEDHEDILRVFVNPDRVGNRQACEAGRLIMDTVMTMQGRDLREALLYFSAP